MVLVSSSLFNKIMFKIKMSNNSRIFCKKMVLAKNNKLKISPLILIIILSISNNNNSSNNKRKDFKMEINKNNQFKLISNILRLSIYRKLSNSFRIKSNKYRMKLVKMEKIQMLKIIILLIILIKIIIIRNIKHKVTIVML
jgi:hypothetical protein